MMRHFTAATAFTGIGAWDLAIERIGGELRWQCEIAPGPRAVLEHHWPGVRRYDDIRTMHTLEPERVHLLAGSPPCQDLSRAGKGAGLDGERSGLVFDFLRLVELLRPRWVAVENVSGGKPWVSVVRRRLHDLGYPSVPIRVQATDVGLPHRRARVLVVADAAGFGLAQRQGLRSGLAKELTATLRVGGEGPAADPDRQGQLRPAEGPTGLQGGMGAGLVLERDGILGTVEPTLARRVHGVPARLERIHALGNAFPPACAEVALRWLILSD